MEQSDLQKKLAAYQQNLASVEGALVQDPNNQQYIELRCMTEVIERKDVKGVHQRESVR